MNVCIKISCRLFQKLCYMVQPFLPYKQPKLLSEVDEIINVLNQQNYNSILLISDRGVRKIGITDVLEESILLSGKSLFIYDKTNSNPTIKNVEEAKQIYLREGCDCIIAFGGGSSIDLAKAVGACVVYPNQTISQLKGLLKVRKSLPTIIAVPTTAGTGSEVTISAVITDQDKKHKYALNNFTMVPKYALLDARLTISLPPFLTATTAMDALTHALEAYVGCSINKKTSFLAEEAIQLIFENIEIAFIDGENERARQNLLKASYKAGLVFRKSYVGYVHAIAHSLGGEYGIAHGLANAVLLPVVLEFYGDCIHKKLYRLAKLIHLVNNEDTYEMGAKKFIDAIYQLNQRLTIPKKLEGIQEKDIPHMAKHAYKEALLLYPVPKMMHQKQLEQIYYKVVDWSNL